MSLEDTKDLTALNSAHSPLLRLPAELRNIIYSYIPDDYLVMMQTRIEDCQYKIRSRFAAIPDEGVTPTTMEGKDSH
ncbi:hypothetical protein K491DRAFT_723818 [Lophiostoma macrostomum CBS 122681]|uniref:Uncharacterized protein n=1 Tax=Lophiostoma macrostomum CBS 122681 TaxID=1314788 RepID=A0A6A6SGW5_9PLEO|nr:hypothetical protein K491DRAFT_723818 [Lophiostoma macrostomum CBS 122681]